MDVVKWLCLTVLAALWVASPVLADSLPPGFSSNLHFDNGDYFEGAGWNADHYEASVFLSGIGFSGNLVGVVAGDGVDYTVTGTDFEGNPMSWSGHVLPDAHVVLGDGPMPVWMGAAHAPEGYGDQLNVSTSAGAGVVNWDPDFGDFGGYYGAIPGGTLVGSWDGAGASVITMFFYPPVGSGVRAGTYEDGVFTRAPIVPGAAASLQIAPVPAPEPVVGGAAGFFLLWLRQCWSRPLRVL